MVANLKDIQRIYNEIPKEWDNENDHFFNYDLLDSESHFAHGWREVSIPEFDAETQKLSNEYLLVDDLVIKKAINLTGQELQAIEDAKIPMLLTASQIRQALVLMGKNPDDVVVAINKIPDATTKAILLIRFEYEIEFVRTNADIIAIANALNVDLIELYKTGGKL